MKDNEDKGELTAADGLYSNGPVDTPPLSLFHLRTAGVNLPTVPRLLLTPSRKLAFVVALFVGLTAASAILMARDARRRPGHNMLALRQIGRH